MENKIVGQAFLPLLVIFIITTIILMLGALYAFMESLDPVVMMIGNLVLFIATSISFYLYHKSLANDNVQAFLRLIYSGMFIKMLLCLFAALIYISIAGKGVSKGAIFGCMFLYFLYTFTEIRIIMKLSKQKQHVKERGSA